MIEGPGNLTQVRAALHGITGLEPDKSGPDRYLVIARMNRELDTVDSFRRNTVPAYWPSYEQLRVTRQKQNGHPVRRLVRVGILPGYVFAAVQPSLDFENFLQRIVGAIDIARTMSGNPLLISDADIRIIRRIEAGLNTPRSGRTAHDFKRGQKVCFVDDLVGRWPPGVIEKLAPDGRISVEVELMGRKVPITVLPHQIERT
jgi:transcription antitermination factor NusG